MSYERFDDVAVVAIDNPPVNALSTPTRAALIEALESAQVDPRVRAIVVLGARGRFSAGADIKAFSEASALPELPQVVSHLEASLKPVVAAIEGVALGGGLELALACHYRIAAIDAQLGLPEVKLGLLPGAGGTQRLPRLVGIELALKMIAEGDAVSARDARSMGLIDHIIDRGLFKDEAIAFARSVADLPRPLTSERKIVPAGVDGLSILDGYGAGPLSKSHGSMAQKACLEALRAAVLGPFEAGLQVERGLFNKLRADPESRALQHIFLAERAASRIDGLPAATPVRPIETVAVLGAGTMGRGIAISFLTAGLPVLLIDPDPLAIGGAVSAVRDWFERSLAKGRISHDEAERAMARLTPSADFEEVADQDLIVEAAFEDMAIKREIFGRLDRVAKPGAVLATNTSYLDLNAIASVTERPQDVVGLHFFSPAHLMKLLEIVRGDLTSPEVLATAMHLAKRLGKVGVVAGVCDGFIANRMMKVRRSQADMMLLEGASPSQIDDVLTAFGFPMGPFQMADLAGLDIGWNPDVGGATTVRERLCELGRRGQKTGAGYYDYGEARRRSPSTVLEQIAEEFAELLGVRRRLISSEEILERSLHPMVSEGRKILAEGVAQRSSDIDVVWVNGFGWPRNTGGPMFWSDRRSNLGS